MDGKSERYISLNYSYLQVAPIKEHIDRRKWKGEEDENEKNTIRKVNEIVDSIKAITKIVEKSEVSFLMKSFGGGKIQEKWTANKPPPKFVPNIKRPKLDKLANFLTRKV